MKIMNKSILILVAAALLAIKPTTVTADEWTGGGTSLNWSDTGNWSGPADTDFQQLPLLQ
jgi:hypothetical protein